MNGSGRLSVVISQPMYFPWPGFFEQMAVADVYVWLDDVQFSKGSFTNRMQAKLDDGRKWISVALGGGGTMTKIIDLRPVSEGWTSSHRELLRQSFDSSPHRDLALSLFDLAVARSPLVECLIASAEEPAKALGVLPRRILRSSRMGIGGRSWQRVLELTKAVGGTRYITAHGGADYLDHEAFEQQGVSVDYMDYSLTPWPQPHGGFTPYVTVLDLIAATGDEAGGFIHPRTLPWRAFLEAKRHPS